MRRAHPGAVRLHAAAALCVTMALLAHAVRADGDAADLPTAPPSAGVGSVFTLEQRYLYAASKGDEAVVMRALELGADPQARDGLGRNALLLAVRGEGDLELVRELAQRGVAFDTPDAGGRTALSYAAGRGDLELLRELERRGAAVDSVDQQGRSPLHHAVARDRHAAVQHLLRAGAELERADRFGDTPLLVACARGHNEMAVLLIEAGADVSHRDREGRSLRERAAPDTPACLAQEQPASAPGR